jgi:hypothetical protein
VESLSEVNESGIEEYIKKMVDSQMDDMRRDQPELVAMLEGERSL